MPLKIAHRGYCITYNNNTVGSIKDAIYNNFDMIEIDIQLDKNDEIMLFHDSHYKDRLIQTYSYNELKEEIPDIILLSTLFQVIDYKNVKIYLDLKGYDILADELHNLFKKMDIDTTNIWIASFNLNHIEIMKEKGVLYNLGLITSNNYTIDILSFIVSKYRLGFVAFDLTMLNKNSIQFLQNRNINVFAYTIKNLDMLKNIELYNVDGFVSDIIL